MGLQHGGRKPVETSWVYFGSLKTFLLSVKLEKKSHRHLSQNIGYSEIESTRWIDIFVHVTCYPETMPMPRIVKKQTKTQSGLPSWRQAIRYTLKKWLSPDEDRSSKFLISVFFWRHVFSPTVALFLGSAVPLFLYSSVSLFLSLFVPPFLRSSIPPFLRSSVPLFLCSSVPLFLCSSVPLFLCSSVPLFLCSSVPLFLRSSITLFHCSFLGSSVPLLLFFLCAYCFVFF